MTAERKPIGHMIIARKPCGKLAATTWDDAEGDYIETAMVVMSWLRRGDSVSRLERYEDDVQPEWACTRLKPCACRGEKAEEGACPRCKLWKS